MSIKHTTITKLNVPRKSMVQIEIYHTFASKLLFIHDIVTRKMQNLNEDLSIGFVCIRYFYRVFSYGKKEMNNGNNSRKKGGKSKEKKQSKLTLFTMNIGLLEIFMSHY